MYIAHHLSFQTHHMNLSFHTHIHIHWFIHIHLALINHTYLHPIQNFSHCHRTSSSCSVVPLQNRHLLGAKKRKTVSALTKREMCTESKCSQKHSILTCKEKRHQQKKVLKIINWNQGTDVELRYRSWLVTSTFCMAYLSSLDHSMTRGQSSSDEVSC